MNKMKPVLIISFLLLIVSCASTKYLGTNQPRLAVSACGIGVTQCFIFDSALDSNGSETSIEGKYFLDRVDAGTYAFHGSVKLEIDDGVLTNIEYLNLIFIFFKDDFVVHEEKIRLSGDVGEYHEFSQIIKSDVVFESSKWAWYNWRARE